MGRVGPVAVMAVSDGAGSAKYSHFGSQAACLAGVASLTRQLQTEPGHSSQGSTCCGAPCNEQFVGARRSVVEVARAGESNRPGGSCATANEYACTLMLSVGQPEAGRGSSRGRRVRGGRRRSRNGCLLSEPDNGEFANETKFLTNPRNLPRVKVTGFRRLTLTAWR